jgi:hypothetical protein
LAQRVQGTAKRIFLVDNLQSGHGLGQIVKI